MSDEARDNGENQAISRALENVRELRKRILDTKTNEDLVWFRNLLCGILNCTLMDYRSVEIGVQKSIYLAAWGRRNLLELKVITEYVLASKQNAADFKNDFLIDVKEFYEAITKSHKASHKTLVSELSEMIKQEEGAMKEVLSEALRRETERGPQTEGSDSESEICKLLMSEYGLKEKAKPKRVSVIAGLIRNKEEFDPMFQICSKIMHRTALSIASSMGQEGLNAMIPLLFNSSVCDLLSIYQSISKYYEENGVRLPRN